MATIRLCGFIKTYRITRPDGWLHAFEISKTFISMGAIRSILSSVDGVSCLVRQFRSDDRLLFFGNTPWIVHEPWGDSSRHWIGPREAENHSLDVRLIHHAFVQYRPPFSRVWELPRRRRATLTARTHYRLCNSPSTLNRP
jgi:hypothetical protein